MARKRRKPVYQAGELNLTAMIDIAFQLLNFFVITTKPVDVFTNFPIFRPQTDAAPSVVQQVDLPIEIFVYKDGYALNKRDLPLKIVGQELGKIAEKSKDTAVIIKCMDDSPQYRLVDILDQCAKVHLSKISIFSM